LFRSSSNKSSTVDSVSTVDKLSKSTDIITVQVDVNGIPHRTELDTGCQRSVLGEDFWRKSLGAPALQKSTNQDHLQSLKSILQRMREAHYFLDKNKCEFMRPYISTWVMLFRRRVFLPAPGKWKPSKLSRSPIQ
jgi:hypothetical protein